MDGSWDTPASRNQDRKGDDFKGVDGMHAPGEEQTSQMNLICITLSNKIASSSKSHILRTALKFFGLLAVRPGQGTRLSAQEQAARAKEGVCSEVSECSCLEERRHVRKRLCTQRSARIVAYALLLADRILKARKIPSPMPKREPTDAYVDSFFAADSSVSRSDCWRLAEGVSFVSLFHHGLVVDYSCFRNEKRDDNGTMKAVKKPAEDEEA
ncbi:hypothetical protein FH972_021326 [Carpinus fangiana]|uniref:Uncharacterized protein n=1 Tax=Carpinus fangiana TaxID=176857 RepID=A0A5N6KP11_9ROSI|nr:hypothetical protein FH972_021326 [Carpinus fangiana]